METIIISTLEEEDIDTFDQTESDSLILHFETTMAVLRRFSDAGELNASEKCEPPIPRFWPAIKWLKFFSVDPVSTAYPLGSDVSAFFLHNYAPLDRINKMAAGKDFGQPALIILLCRRKSLTI